MHSVTGGVLALATMWACTGPKGPPVPTVHGIEGPTGSTAETGATGHTGSTPDTADTGADFVDPYLSIQPSVRLLGTPGMALGVEGLALLPAYGDDPGVLLIGNRAQEPLYLKSFVLAGDALGRGDKGVLSVWDGASRADYHSDVAPGAGDVNGDGHLDWWLGAELFTGPFLGRHLAYGEGVAIIDGGALPRFADFDADGDGNEDMVADVNCCQLAYLFYGPFEGTIAAPFLPDPDPDTTEFSGNGCADAANAVLLRDNLGPGHHAVAVGELFAGGCSINTYVFDLMAPRGSDVTVNDAVGSGFVDGWTWDGVGDIDGDGYGDAVYADVNGGLLLRGPMHDDAFRGTRRIEQLNGNVMHGVGDINGDGVEELLAFWPESLYPLSGQFTLLFSPHPAPLDVAAGLVLGSHLALNYTSFGEVTGDLDGDGRSDLVDHTVIEDDRGAVRIWYGADLLAAEEARIAAPP